MLELYATQDGQNLYVNIVGEVENNGNAFYLGIDVSSQTGVAAGTALPGAAVDEGPGGTRAFNAYQATHDFETDYGIVLKGTGSSSASMGVINYVADTTDDGRAPFEYLTADGDTTFVNDGSAVSLSSASYDGTVGSYLDTGSLDNHTGTEAWEFSIPLSALGASPGDDFQLFALYMSGNGDFVSSNTLPEIPGQGGTNLEGNPDFTSISGDQHTAPDPLPVDLTSFDVTTDARDAVLSWTTASETNNAGFEVQHAVGEGDYQAVSFVEGAGTTTEPQSYRFRVGDLASGTHHFRLKQVDLDGTETLGPERTITVSLQQAVAFEPIAPNPAQGTASFSFATREAQDVTVTLFNVLGQQVATLYAGKTAPEQTQSVQIDTGDLTSGAYFVRVQGETFTETRRLTVLQ